MNNDKFIIRVEFFSNDGIRGEWISELKDPRTGEPLIVSSKQVSDAVFYLDVMRDMRPMTELRAIRDMRAEAIKMHFAKCARILTQQIEEREGMDNLYPPNKGNSTSPNLGEQE